MNIIRQHIKTILVLTFIAPMLLGCASDVYTNTPVVIVIQSQATTVPGNVQAPNPAFAFAQATIDAGQSQLSDISRNSTTVSLNMEQAANAAAQSTLDYNQRQKMDFDYQATIISLNIAHAAATQEFLRQQTVISRNATAAVQNAAAAATHAAYLINVTQTAQAQAILNAQVLQTDQAAAALTAFPITATYAAQVILNAQATQTAQAVAILAAQPLTTTPMAATQAALLMQQYNREQQSFITRIVAPMVPIVATLDLLFFVLVIILAFRQYLPMPWPQRLRLARVNIMPNPLMLIDGLAVDQDSLLHPKNPTGLPPVNPPGLPCEKVVRVEIINATDSPVTHWLSEVERQLAAEGR